MRTKAEEKGIAKGVDMFASADEIHAAIVEVRDNLSYAANARRLSALYRAHPRHPMDDAVWLVEYVGDTGGARHLLHASRRLNFVQYYSLDVLVCIKNSTVSHTAHIGCNCVNIEKLSCRENHQI